MWCKYNQGRICEGCMWCYDTEDEDDEIKDEDTEGYTNDYE